MGPGLGPRAGVAAGPHRHGYLPGVLGPRGHPRHRQPRHDREDLGGRDLAGADLAPGAPRRRLGAGLRRRRAPDGHRRLRRLGAALGARRAGVLAVGLPGVCGRGPRPGVLARRSDPPRRRGGRDRALGRPRRLDRPAARRAPGRRRCHRLGARRHQLRGGDARRLGPPLRCRFRPRDRVPPRARRRRDGGGLFARLPPDRLGRPRPGPSTSGTSPAAGSWGRSRPRAGRSPPSGSRPTAGRWPSRPGARARARRRHRPR